MSILSTDPKSLEEHVTRRSESLLDSLAVQTAPVPLRPLVTLCGIQRVVFRPLLVTGGLSVDKTGFSIYVKASRDEARRWPQMFNAEDDGGRGLPGRVRFTIAHEIAHTFFFQCRSGKPVSLVDHEEESQLRYVERACNRGAAALLLPERLVRPFIHKRPWTQSLLRSAAAAFNVSFETLLWRLHELPEIMPPHSMAAVIREDDTRLSIRALVAGTKVQEQLSGCSLSRVLELLRVSEGRFAAAESSWTVALDDKTRERAAGARDCELRLECLYERPRTGLLTARVSSIPQLVFPFR